jgi:integrase
VKKKVRQPSPANDSRRGCIITKRGSKNLYVLFYYFGKRIEFSTGAPDTKENRRTWEAWLDRNMARIKDGIFRYAEAFPGASPEKKALFTRLEGSEYQPEPSSITFSQFVERYIEKVLSNFPSATKREDYQCVIRSRLLPFFGDMTFREITRNEVGRFIATLIREDEEATTATRPSRRR